MKLCGIFKLKATAIAAALVSFSLGAETFDFNADWEYVKPSVSHPLAAARASLTNGIPVWSAVSLPHCESAAKIFSGRAAETGCTAQYRGVLFYRKNLVIEGEGVGEGLGVGDGRWILEFESLRQALYVSVNGTLIGYYEGGIAPSGFDLTQYLEVGTNEIVVACDSVSNRGTDDYLHETIPGHEPGDLSGASYQWNVNDFNPTLSGITGNVKLHHKGDVYLTLPLYNNLKTQGTYVTASDFDFSNRTAKIKVKAEIRNEYYRERKVSIRVDILDGTNVVGSFTSADKTIAKMVATNYLTAVESDVYETNALPTRINSPVTDFIEASGVVSNLVFWSPDTPHLYDVKVTLLAKDGSEIECMTIRTGFRKTGYDPKRGILINDEPVWLTGYAQRATDEWAAIGIGNDWLNDYDARLIRESGANFVRWMHIAPKPAPVRSFDKYGVVCVAPAGDKESDASGRNWTMREEAMRDAIIYFRNSPSILFWEAGNNKISGEHMASMRAIKDALDPDGWRRIGCRTISSSNELASAEWVGTMLNRHAVSAYDTMISMGRYIPIVETEYAREESPRRVWDDFSPPYYDYIHRSSVPLDEGKTVDYYDLTQEDFIRSNASGYREFYGNRVSGVNSPYYSACAALCWTDSIQHGRNCYAENGRMSGRVDPVRLKKTDFAAYQAFQARKPTVKLLGHWSYPELTKTTYLAPEYRYEYDKTGTNITAISTNGLFTVKRDPKNKTVYAAASVHCAHVELEVDGEVVARDWKPDDVFMFKFENIDITSGDTVSVVAYDKALNEIARDTIERTGTAARLELVPTVGPEGWQADGADIAMVDVRLVDDEGRVLPCDESKIEFRMTGEAQWMGGYNSGVYGDKTAIAQDWVKLECGENRVFMKAGRKAGDVTLTASCAEYGLSASVTLTLKEIAITNGISSRAIQSYPANRETFAVTNTAEAVNDLNVYPYPDGDEPQYGLIVTNGATKVHLGHERFVGPVIIKDSTLRFGTPQELDGCSFHHDFGVDDYDSVFTNRSATATNEITTINGRSAIYNADARHKMKSAAVSKSLFAVLQCHTVPAYGSLVYSNDTGGKRGECRWYWGRHNKGNYWELYQYNGWVGTTNLWQDGSAGCPINTKPMVIDRIGKWTHYDSESLQFGGGYQQSWCEVVLFNRELEKCERVGIEDYLMWKWGVRDYYNPIPSDSDVVMGGESVLDLGGLTVNVASFYGTGIISNGVLITALPERQYQQGEGDLTIPAVDGATYIASSSDYKLKITGCATNITICLPSGWLKRGVSRATIIYCEGTPTFEDTDGTAKIASLGNGWWSFTSDEMPLTFTWVGDETGEWQDPSNWSSPLGSGYPGVIDDAIVSNTSGYVGLTLGGETQVSNLWVYGEASIADGTLKPKSVKGTGTLSLQGGAGLADNGASFEVSCDLLIGGNEENPCFISLSGYSPTISGNLKGDGYLKTTSARQKSIGVALTGDNGAFRGTIHAVPNNIPRNYITLADSGASSSNASWNVYNGGKGTFCKTGYTTYYFGSLSGSVVQYDQMTAQRIVFEIGALGKDDSLGGDYFQQYPSLVNERGHTIRKVGTGTLTFTGRDVNAYEANGGVLSIEEPNSLEWVYIYTSKAKITITNTYHSQSISFGGGALREGPTVPFDISTIFKSAGGVLAFDDGGIDRMWSVGIPSSFTNGFVKSGAGTLTLPTKPLYTGPTVIQEGLVDFAVGASLEDLTLGDGAGLVLTNGTVTARSVTLQGAATIVLSAIPEDGKIMALSNGFEQEADLTLIVDGVRTTGYTLVSKSDGLYVMKADVVLLNGRGFATLPGALKAAQSGDTLTITKNLSTIQRCDINVDNLTIDFGGMSFSSTSRWAFNVGTNSLVVMNGTLSMSEFGFYVTDGCVAFSNATLTASGRVAQVRGPGTIDVGYNATLITTGYDPTLFAVGGFYGRATVNSDGTLISPYPSTYAGNPNDSFGVDFNIAKPLVGFMFLICDDQFEEVSNSTTQNSSLKTHSSSLVTPIAYPIDLDGNPCDVETFPARTTAYDYSRLKTERLGRGLVAFRSAEDTVCISWRYLSSDPIDIAFDVYRDDTLIASNVTQSTQIYDTFTYDNISHTYTLQPSTLNSQPSTFNLQPSTSIGYFDIPLSIPPPNVVTNGGEYYTYIPEEASAGDVDGDGEMEIILKWDPSFNFDNAASGWSGEVILECLEFDGTSRWRINLGRNIRAGSHYTQFMVGDFDSDGKCEMICKTADGTKDGLGNVIGDANADYRDASGKIMDGPEYLTVFDGETGRAIDTVGYLPVRGDIAEARWTKPRGWGDQYGNRCDRFLACPAYLDGEHLSCVMCRGYYKRSALTAWDFDGTNLTARWLFDTTNELISTSYQGQGFHNLYAGDVDFDGKDEIVYGQMVVDDDGSPLYSTGLGHGDAMHLLQVNPLWRGLQVWSCQEAGIHGVCLRDAGTGEIFIHHGAGGDTGRGVAGDVTDENFGAEMWASTGIGMYASDGTYLGSADGISMSFLCWWTGSLERSSLPGANVYKYSLAGHGQTRITDWKDVVKSNGTKSTPVLSADLLGDWREEVILAKTDYSALRVFLSPEPTEYRFHTFLEDPVYRHSIATQNVAYNQPTHTGFYFGPDLKGHRLLFRGTVIP